MPSFSEKLAQICGEELAYFGQGAKKEYDEGVYKRVGEYWKALGQNFNGRSKVKNGNGQLIRPAWSAAFVSWVMKKAGAGPRFSYREAHCHYIALAMAARQANEASAGYWAHPPEARAPQIGDLVCAGREYAKDYNFNTAKTVYKADSFYPSHADIVVAVDLPNQRAHAIGGNVGDSVSLTEVHLDSSGFLKPRLGTDKKEHPWIAVMECRIAESQLIA